MTSAVPAPCWRVIERRRSLARPTAVALAVGAVCLLGAGQARAAPDEVAETAPVEGEDADTLASSEEPASAEAPTDVDGDSPGDDAGAEAEAGEETPAEVPPPGVDETTEDPEDPEDEVVSDADAESETEPEETIRVPRFDGPYVGVAAFGTANFASVIDLDTPSPLIGTSGFLQAGDAVFPWMSIGVAAGGGAAWIGNQQMFVGALLVEFGFAPIKQHPFTIRAGFGFGGGAIAEPEVPRAGYGGALFKGSFRYEFFPVADRKRPTRGGGWAIGPELGWMGATPAGPGQPFVNTVLLGLSTSFYFGS